MRLFILQMLMLIAAAAAAIAAGETAISNDDEVDGEASSRIIGSSVVTSVSVVMNGLKPQFTDAVGRPVPRPLVPPQVASPINLLNPDKYEFYTFDEAGELIKRLMTMEEIQSIVAGGDGEGTMMLHSIASNNSEPDTKVQDIVDSVQNVLTKEMESQNNQSNVNPILDTPDVSSSWNLILPAIFGNTGDQIIPQKPQSIGMTAESVLLEETTQKMPTQNKVTTVNKNKPSNTKRPSASSVKPTRKTPTTVTQKPTQEVKLTVTKTKVKPTKPALGSPTRRKPVTNKIELTTVKIIDDPVDDYKNIPLYTRPPQNINSPTKIFTSTLGTKIIPVRITTVQSEKTKITESTTPSTTTMTTTTTTTPQPTTTTKTTTTTPQPTTTTTTTTTTPQPTTKTTTTTTTPQPTTTTTTTTTTPQPTTTTTTTTTTPQPTTTTTTTTTTPRPTTTTTTTTTPVPTTTASTTTTTTPRPTTTTTMTTTPEPPTTSTTQSTTTSTEKIFEQIHLTFDESDFPDKTDNSISQIIESLQEDQVTEKVLMSENKVAETASPTTTENSEGKLESVTTTEIPPIADDQELIKIVVDKLTDTQDQPEIVYTKITTSDKLASNQDQPEVVFTKITTSDHTSSPDKIFSIEQLYVDEGEPQTFDITTTSELPILLETTTYNEDDFVETTNFNLYSEAMFKKKPAGIVQLVDRIIAANSDNIPDSVPAETQQIDDNKIEQFLTKMGTNLTMSEYIEQAATAASMLQEDEVTEKYDFSHLEESFSNVLSQVSDDRPLSVPLVEDKNVESKIPNRNSDNHIAVPDETTLESRTEFVTKKPEFLPETTSHKDLDSDQKFQELETLALLREPAQESQPIIDEKLQEQEDNDTKITYETSIVKETSSVSVHRGKPPSIEMMKNSTDTTVKEPPVVTESDPKEPEVTTNKVVTPEIVKNEPPAINVIPVIKTSTLEAEKVGSISSSILDVIGAIDEDVFAEQNPDNDSLDDAESDEEFNTSLTATTEEFDEKLLVNDEKKENDSIKISSTITTTTARVETTNFDIQEKTTIDYNNYDTTITDVTSPADNNGYVITETSATTTIETEFPTTTIEAVDEKEMVTEKVTTEMQENVTEESDDSKFESDKEDDKIIEDSAVAESINEKNEFFEKVATTTEGENLNSGTTTENFDEIKSTIFEDLTTTPIVETTTILNADIFRKSDEPQVTTVEVFTEKTTNESFDENTQKYENVENGTVTQATSTVDYDVTTKVLSTEEPVKSEPIKSIFSNIERKEDEASIGNISLTTVASDKQTVAEEKVTTEPEVTDDNHTVENVYNRLGETTINPVTNEPTNTPLVELTTEQAVKEDIVTTEFAKESTQKPIEPGNIVFHVNTPKPKLPPSKQGQNTATVTRRPIPIELNPAPKESLGLEQSTVNVDEDILEFTKLCNELAFSYWKAVTSEGVSTTRSAVIAPFAITSMLAMVFLGARGSTSGEMNEILRLDDMVTFNPHLVFRNVTDSIENLRENGVYTSAIVREMFSDRSKGKLLPFYKEKAQQFYSGYVEEVNYNVINDIIRRRTNLLMKRHTWGKVMVFLKTNTITLRPPLAGVSANIFQTDCSKASTADRDGEMFFQVTPSVRQRRLVPIPAAVWRSGFTAGYDPELDATAIAFGNSNNIVSTVFVMPGQQGHALPGDNLDRLEVALLQNAITKNGWRRLLTTLMERPGLEVQLPRFIHRSYINATSALQRMGLKHLFDYEKSDLRGLTASANKDIFFSDMVQVNSFGTCGEDKSVDQHHDEVYPAPPLQKQFYLGEFNNRDYIDVLADNVKNKLLETQEHQRALYDPFYDTKYLELPLPLRPRQARIPEAPRLRFDRPFLYFVRHNPTGMILYMGRFNPRLLP